MKQLISAVAILIASQFAFTPAALAVTAEHDGSWARATLTLPPLATIWLELEPEQ